MSWRNFIALNANIRRKVFVPTLRNQKKKSKFNRVRRKEINKDQIRNSLSKNQEKTQNRKLDDL